MMTKLLLLIPIAAAFAESTQPLPTADEVVAKMIARDSERQSALYGYRAPALRPGEKASSQAS